MRLLAIFLILTSCTTTRPTVDDISGVPGAGMYITDIADFDPTLMDGGPVTHEATEIIDSKPKWIIITREAEKHDTTEIQERCQHNYWLKMWYEGDVCHLCGWVYHEPIYIEPKCDHVYVERKFVDNEYVCIKCMDIKTLTRPLSEELKNACSCGGAIMQTEVYCSPPVLGCNTCTCMTCGKSWDCY